MPGKDSDSCKREVAAHGPICIANGEMQEFFVGTA